MCLGREAVCFIWTAYVRLSACDDVGMAVRAGGEPWVYTPVVLSQNGHQNVSESFRKPAVLPDVLFDTQQDILSFVEYLFS